MDINDRYVEVKEQLRDHDRRIISLEKAEAEAAVRIENLCNELKHLTSWIKALVVALITASGGFFIWYVQSLPR